MLKDVNRTTNEKRGKHAYLCVFPILQIILYTICNESGKSGDIR